MVPALIVKKPANTKFAGTTLNFSTSLEEEEYTVSEPDSSKNIVKDYKLSQNKGNL